MRAGVGRADQAFWFGTCIPRSYERGYTHLQCCSAGRDRQVSLARICRTVLLHPCWEKTDGVRKNAATKAVVPARATLVRSKFSVGRRCWVLAGCRARFDLHQTLDDAEVVPSNQTESGAGAPRSKNFCSNPSQQRRREQGRARSPLRAGVSHADSVW